MLCARLSDPVTYQLYIKIHRNVRFALREAGPNRLFKIDHAGQIGPTELVLCRMRLAV